MDYFESFPNIWRLLTSVEDDCGGFKISLKDVVQLISNKICHKLHHDISLSSSVTDMANVVQYFATLSTREL